MRRDCFQADQTRRATTQKTRSRVLKLGRGRRHFRTEIAGVEPSFQGGGFGASERGERSFQRKSDESKHGKELYQNNWRDLAARLLISLSAGVLANHRVSRPRSVYGRRFPVQWRPLEVNRPWSSCFGKIRETLKQLRPLAISIGLGLDVKLALSP